MTKMLFRTTGCILVWAATFGAALGQHVPAGINAGVMSAAYWQLWNPRVQARIDSAIEHNRKADAVVKIPGIAQGTTVRVEQLTHAFYFGANIFNFNQLGTRERNERYKELFGTLFNSATVPFYWKTFEMQPNRLRFREEYWDTEDYWNNVDSPKTQPHWRRPAPDPIVSYLERRGVRIHGHNMIWGNNRWQRPDWLFDVYCPPAEKEAIEKLGGLAAFGKLSPEQMEAAAPGFAGQLKILFKKRVVELSRHYGDRIPSWDIVNESAHDYRGRVITGNAYYDHSVYGVMPGDYVYDAFKTAAMNLPASVKLNINDYANDQNYANQAKDLMAHGCKIDIMGSQMHLFKPQQCLDIAAGKAIQTPGQVWHQMEVLAQAGLPIHVSEITITAPGDDARGRAIQAVIAYNLYRLWFSIKPLMGITWWNVVDDCGAPGEPTTSGIFTRDMQPKPSYFALRELINHDWTTKKTVKAEKGGEVRFRGFKGDYLVSWTDDRGVLQQLRFSLLQDGDGATVSGQ